MYHVIPSAGSRNNKPFTFHNPTDIHSAALRSRAPGPRLDLTRETNVAQARAYSHHLSITEFYTGACTSHAVAVYCMVIVHVVGYNAPEF